MIGRRRMSSKGGSVCKQRTVLRQSLFAAIAVACFSLGISVLAAGQAATSLRGSVTDSSGSTIAGAEVVLASPESKTERTATTSDQGEYQFLFVSPGTYTLTVTARGFQRYQI